MIGISNKTLAGLYLDGKTTYSRTSNTALSAEGVSVIAHAAEQCGIGFDPSGLPMLDEQNEKAHEAQRPTMEGLNHALEIIHTDPAILSESDFCLAEITRQLIACGANVQIESPDIAGYPEWARELDWQRPADKTAGFLLQSDLEIESGYYPYPVDLIALDQMLKYGLGRPSTLAGHAEKFAERDLYQPETGVQEKGIRWAGMTPDIFLWPETSVAIEEVLDVGEEYESDRACIDRALEILRREEQETIRKHLRFQALADAFNGGCPDRPDPSTGAGHRADIDQSPVSPEQQPAGLSL